MIATPGQLRVLTWSTVISSLLIAPLCPAAIRYRIEAHTPRAEPVEVALCARRVDAASEVIRQLVKVPSEGELPATEGTWEVFIESSALWAPASYVRSSESVVIVTRPAATLTAPISTDGRSVPKEVRLLLTPVLSLRGDASPQTLSILCPVTDGGAIACTVPQGTFDVRISAAGHAPYYAWNVAAPDGNRVALPPIRLIRGAAVVGRVLYQPEGVDSALPLDARISVLPASSDASSRVSMQAKPNLKGFFTVPAVPPGEYLITAHTKELSSDSHRIKVHADATTEIHEPLVITPSKVIHAFLSPPLDPEGLPWSVTLWRRSGSQRELVSSSSVQADGRWEQSVRRGAYSLTVARRDGAQWASTDVVVDAEDVDVPLLIPAVVASGSVQYGDQPIAAKLHFGGESRRPRQTVTSDERGEFRGVLPVVEGHVWEVLVEAEVPSVSRTLHDVRGRITDEGLVFDIVLPRTFLSGSVVNSDGSPEPHAIVTAYATSRKATADQVTAAADGSFELHGVEPGRYRISAESYLKASDDVHIEVVRDGEQAPVLVVLKPVKQLRGRVVAHGRIPVIGASIDITRRNGTPASASGRTNEAGAFAIVMPAETTVFDLLVAPPGFAVTMVRLPLRAEKDLLVDVEPYGGMITVDVPRATVPMLQHAGALASVDYLARSIQGATIVDAGKRRVATLPMMERGEYTVCIGGGRCKSGYLAPGGTLALVLE